MPYFIGCTRPYTGSVIGGNSVTPNAMPNRGPSGKSQRVVFANSGTITDNNGLVIDGRIREWKTKILPTSRDRHHGDEQVITKTAKPSAPFPHHQGLGASVTFQEPEAMLEVHPSHASVHT
jgi:hypothetical protein